VVCGKSGDWKRGSPRESAVSGMNRVRLCEFILVRRIPIDSTRGAHSHEQGSGLQWKFIKMDSGIKEGSVPIYCSTVCSVTVFNHAIQPRQTQFSDNDVTVFYT